MDSAVNYPAGCSRKFRQYPKASLDHMSLTSKAYCQVNWKKNPRRDHKETVLTTYYYFITTILININSQCI